MKTGLTNAFVMAYPSKRYSSMFPNDETAEKKWFVRKRWSKNLVCPHCGCDNVQSGAVHKSMSSRCHDKDYQRRFSVKARTIMEGSKIGYQLGNSYLLDDYPSGIGLQVPFSPSLT